MVTLDSPAAAAPPLIDPAAAVLERAGRHLFRVHPLAVDLPGGAAWADAVHVFGDAPDVGRCEVLFGYSAAGRLVARAAWDQFSWDDLGPAADELTGRAADRPSVRLVFRDEEAAVRFSRLVRAAYEGAGVAPGLCALIRDGLTGPPRLVPVADPVALT